MKDTGRTNFITGEAILQYEEHDIDFWDKPFDELSDEEIVKFLSFQGIGFFSRSGEFSNVDKVKSLYEYFSLKNTMEL